MERSHFVNALPSIIPTAHILDGLQLTTRRTGGRLALHVPSFRSDPDDSFSTNVRHQKGDDERPPCHSRQCLSGAAERAPAVPVMSEPEQLAIYDIRSATYRTEAACEPWSAPNGDGW